MLPGGSNAHAVPSRLAIQKKKKKKVGSMINNNINNLIIKFTFSVYKYINK